MQGGIHSRKKGHSKEVTTHIDIAHPIGNPHSQLLLVKVGHGVCVPAWCVGFFASRSGNQAIFIFLQLQLISLLVLQPFNFGVLLGVTPLKIFTAKLFSQ